VEHALATGRLAVLSGQQLDQEALDALWQAWRGDEDELCSFLEREATRSVDPRPAYLPYLARRLQPLDPAGAARIVNRYLAGEPPPPGRIRWLRLALAELLTRDPLQWASSPAHLRHEAHVRDVLACLRECTEDDRAASVIFTAALEKALAALFDLRAASRQGRWAMNSRLPASESVVAVLRTAEGFAAPAVTEVARSIGRYLALGFDAATVDAYRAEKDGRLVPSPLGRRLGAWWRDVEQSAGPLDFFHHHQAYRYSRDEPLSGWWGRHLHGMTAREALTRLVESLDASARRMEAIEADYRAARSPAGPPAAPFGIAPHLDACSSVLRAALAPGAGVSEVMAVEHALQHLGIALRGIDVSRLIDAPDVLYDPRLPTGRYLLPHAMELFGHWRRNAGGGDCFEAFFEVQDDSGHDVLCLMCLDAGHEPAPALTDLRGLAPFADLVEALGGHLHLWMARPGEKCGCRRRHGDDFACAADDYIGRIQTRLHELASTRWGVRQPTVEAWRGVLDVALEAKGAATVAFAVLPRMTG
jgi:hypothetical protein